MSPKRNPWYKSYCDHKSRAKSRGIGFLLAFEEWLKIWTDSGHIQERGHWKGTYVMARFGDKGPYAVGNVRICTAEENCVEAMVDRKLSEQTCLKMSVSAKGNKRALGSKSRTGQKQSEQAKAKIRVAWEIRKLTPFSDETKAKMSIARRAYLQRQRELKTKLNGEK